MSLLNAVRHEAASGSSLGSPVNDAFTSVNLDFDAKVPIPFSVFPSSYRSDAVTETTRVRVEGEADLPPPASRVGREGHEEKYSSFSASLPGRQTEEKKKVDIRIEKETPNSYHREELVVKEEDRDRYRRPREEVKVYEQERYRRERVPEVEVTKEQYTYKQPRFAVNDIKLDVEVPRYPEIDIAEREYRKRTQPIYDVEYERRAPREREEVRVEAESTTTTTVEQPRRSNMGYYDDSGRYHSFRDGLEKGFDRILHPLHPHRHHRTEREEIIVDRDEGSSRPRENVRYVERNSGGGADTITIPCHHVRIGDLLVLQGRPCQVIRITSSAQTGQMRYLGVDLFTKQLHEESSFVTNPAPSVVVQNMLGPVFKQYRVLDIRDDGRVVAMTETGDVKQGLEVIDQGGLFARLSESFDNGRGSVRVLVINDGGRELAVDYKVIHGSRL
ncbi:MAG: hypothetical protein MMC33_008302 [Icmadophila ericetorum]|nr:hypothetical protein [Icmadophila ericetorum]